MAGLIRACLNVRLDKTHQTSEWGERPLSQGQHHKPTVFADFRHRCYLNDLTDTGGCKRVLGPMATRFVAGSATGHKTSYPTHEDDN
eukprot:6911616-Pyramimonas_sp.AAC.1